MEDLSLALTGVECAPLYHQQGFLSHCLERILKDSLEKQPRCNQAEFRKDTSCTDRIVTLRITIKLSNECQTPLYMHFIHF